MDQESTEATNTIKCSSWMLPMVIYITIGVITDWGNPSFKSFGDSIALSQVALHIIGICGSELHSICFKKCTHTMTMGYFLQYIAFHSWPGIIVLVPIFSLYGYLAGALGNQVVYCLCLLAPKLFTVYVLGTKPFVLITLPRAVNRGTSITPKPVFYIKFTLFLDGFSEKQEMWVKTAQLTIW